MRVKVVTARLPEVLLIEPDIHRDHRGQFFEAHRKNVLRDVGIGGDFVQSNASTSIAWTLRGMHYQVVDPQGKLVRCLRGAIYDVAVDMRKGSLTFGKWVGTRLDEFSLSALWVPPGFAHGFLAMGSGAIVHYECSSYYAAVHDRSLKWDDPEVGITWPTMGNSVVISGKDRVAKSLHECEPVEL